jgi:hypothetical protein
MKDLLSEFYANAAFYLNDTNNSNKIDFLEYI